MGAKPIRRYKASSLAKIAYGTYKRNAKRRGIEFNITLEEFTDLTSQRCDYCGTEPNIDPSRWVNSSKSNQIINTENYLINGVDRIDSEDGYSIENVAPACSKCNSMKSNMSRDEFIEHVCSIIPQICRIIKDPSYG